jgi:hypothetical protein
MIIKGLGRIMPIVALNYVLFFPSEFYMHNLCIKKCFCLCKHLFVSNAHL